VAAEASRHEVTHTEPGVRFIPLNEMTPAQQAAANAQSGVRTKTTRSVAGFTPYGDPQSFPMP
jgi:hypothetical protein